MTPERTAPDRRTVLRTVGGLATASTAALAGCAQEEPDLEDAVETLPGSDYPSVENWLTGTEVGGEDESYDGEIADLRGQDQAGVSVGAEGNGDGFAFDPSAVAVSPGAEVRWQWTGQGGQHNVHAAPDEQLGESDYEFSFGEPQAGEDVTYSFAFDEAGVALYHCTPHLSAGMKGAVVVAERDGDGGASGDGGNGTS